MISAWSGGHAELLAKGLKLLVDVVLARPEFTNQGYTPEAYAFVGTIYWTLCFSMSRAAQRLETRLGVGTR